MLAVCAPLVLVTVARLGAPADGTATFPSAPAWGDGVVLAAVTGQSGDPRPGDRVVSVNGRPLASWLESAPPESFREGGILWYGVRRGDSPQVRSVAVVVRRYPLGQVVAAHAALQPFLLALLAVAAFVFLRRPGIRPPGRCSGGPHWSRWDSPGSRTPRR
jgi:hypothetical protein